MSVHACRLVNMTMAAALFVAIAQPGFGDGLKYKSITVKTPDGLAISAQEWGNPAGPEILFIHGFSQSHLSWMRQVEGDLAKEFRIVTYDLRGHGNSDKPLDAARYRDSKAWGDEVLPKVRAGLAGRPLDATEMMSKLKLPVLVTHGAEDRNAKLGAGQYTASVIPGAKLSVYEGIGHSPFYEDAPRFNTELAAFVRAAAKTD